MSYVFDLHRRRMTRGLRRIYAENTRATPLQLTPAYNPQRPYPYFTEKLRQLRTPQSTLPTRTPRFTHDQPTFIRNEAFNPDTWWNAEMRNRRAWVVECESPYKGWPRTRLQSGILV